MKLEGKNILVRDWIMDDLKLYKFWNTGYHLWMDFDGPYYPKMEDYELQFNVDYITKVIENKRRTKPRRRLVIALKDTNQLIGTISWYWQSQETNWKSIGLALYDEKQWGRTYGFQALKLWIDYLFEADSDMVRLDLRTWSGNIRMIKLAEKLGFQEEARFRKARIVKGEYFDGIAMGILKEEWKTLWEYESKV